ncbi:MAG TPA: hypothetical protein VGG38_10795 [Acidimicrobiales bacterium]
MLNTIQLAGGGSAADANSNNLAEALGTGVCVDTSASTNPCPTSPSSSNSGVAFQTTQTAVQNGANGTATPSPAGAANCLTGAPLNLAPLANIGLFCGSASASEASGEPTATGTGSLASIQVLNLSMTSFLNATGLLGSIGGSNCSSTPAASSAAGLGTGSLLAPVTSLLGTVNSLLGVVKLPALNATSVDDTSAATGDCSILGGLLGSISSLPGASVLTNLLTDLTNTVNLANLPPLLSVTLGGSSSTVSNSTTGGATVVTAHAHQESVDINVLGMLDIQVTPTDAAVALNQSTGVITPTCSSGVISVTTGSGLPTVLGLNSLGSLGTTLNNLLSQLGSGVLGSLLGDLLNFQPDGILSCNITATGASADTIDLNLLPNLPVVNGALLSLQLGNVSANAGTTAATPNAVTTQAATTPIVPAATPAAPAAAAVVPNVTTVHTGEFWAGSLPIFLITGMGLMGLAMVSRRRLFSVTRSLTGYVTRSRS